MSCGVRSFVVSVDRGEGFQGGMGSEGGPLGLGPELTANEKPSEALLVPVHLEHGHYCHLTLALICQSA